MIGRKIRIKRTYPINGSIHYPYQVNEYWIKLGYVKRIYPLIYNWVIVIFYKY
jgi:hypothetical protein